VNWRTFKSTFRKSGAKISFTLEKVMQSEEQKLVSLLIYFRKSYAKRIAKI
jgi:hypothetical protein